MASDSREDTGAGTTVPAELDEWLDDHAASLGVDRERLVVQILSSYHAAATLDGQIDAAGLLDLDADDFVDVEGAVADAVDEQVDARLDDLVAERVEAALEERTDSTDDRVDDRIDDRIDELDSEFRAKITDVRERVVQVKREVDAKAPADHTHDELAAVESLDDRIEALAADLDDLREDLTDRLDERENDAVTLTDRVDDVAEKLDRVAWVLSDLKEETAGRDAYEQALARIRRAAAQEGVSTANCERCGESVEIALLNDPECPHCQATVSDVRPVGGLFRTKARLVAAAQLEAGEGPDA